MRVAKTFQPGQNGTKGLALEFGRRLVCVRHRYDDANATRVTTVELVVDTVPLRGRAPPPRAVGEPWTLTHIRLAADERGLRRSVIAGGSRGCRNTVCGRCRVGSSHGWACTVG
jgi:hypothetical protein